MLDALPGLFASGRIVDLILGLVALEALALLLWRRRRGHGPSPASLLCNLGSGAALMLAVRAALVGAAWSTIALCLLGALIAHGADLVARLRDHPVALGRREPNAGTGTPREAAALPARP